METITGEQSGCPALYYVYFRAGRIRISAPVLHLVQKRTESTIYPPLDAHRSEGSRSIQLSTHLSAQPSNLLLHRRCLYVNAHRPRLTPSDEPILDLQALAAEPSSRSLKRLPLVPNVFLRAQSQNLKCLLPPISSWNTALLMTPRDTLYLHTKCAYFEYKGKEKINNHHIASTES